MDYTEQAEREMLADEKQYIERLGSYSWRKSAIRERAEVLRLREENAKLSLSLRKLRHEVYALHAFEPEVRDAIGHSNWRCLMDRAKESEEPPCQS